MVAYGALLPRVALDVPRHGWVNLHFSLLPAWRGAAPVQRAVMAGDEVTGASTFVIEEGLDTGPVLGTLTEAVRPRDTAGTLLDRLADLGAGLLVATMDGLEEGSLRALPQPAEGVSLAPKLAVEECRVRWSLPAHLVDRHVRGCTPNPGAWSTFRGERLKVGPLDPAPASRRPAVARPRRAPPDQAGGVRRHRLRRRSRCARSARTGGARWPPPTGRAGPASHRASGSAEQPQAERCSSTARSRSAYCRCHHSSLRMVSRHSRTGYDRLGPARGRPRAPCRPASASSVRSSR